MGTSQHARANALDRRLTRKSRSPGGADRLAEAARQRMETPRGDSESDEPELT
jgi:hypothetical protein